MFTSERLNNGNGIYSRCRRVVGSVGTSWNVKDKRPYKKKKKNDYVRLAPVVLGMRLYGAILFDGQMTDGRTAAKQCT